jgi:hypothetical protein
MTKVRRQGNRQSLNARLGSCAAANKERAALATELSNKRFERNAKQLGGVLARPGDGARRLTVASLHGRNLARSPLSAGVRSCSANSSELLTHPLKFAETHQQ